MPSMTVSLDLTFGDAGATIDLDVEFKVTAEGCPAHMGSLSYPGHPAEGPEIEIEHVYWPYVRRLRDGETALPGQARGKGFTRDHLDVPTSMLTQDIFEAIEAYIVENYEDPGPDPDYELEALRDR